MCCFLEYKKSILVLFLILFLIPKSVYSKTDCLALYRDDNNTLTVEQIEEFCRKLKPAKEIEFFAKIALEEAIIAAKEGNFGVGALIVDSNGFVIVKGHNKVFYPKFKSDLHAEMVTINKFEELNSNLGDFKYKPTEVILITSLEPCPMCYTRAVVAGIGKIIYIGDDEPAGMVHVSENMPEVFKKISTDNQQEFFKAKVSPQIAYLSEQISVITRKILDKKLGEKKKEEEESFEEKKYIHGLFFSAIETNSISFDYVKIMREFLDQKTDEQYVFKKNISNDNKIKFFKYFYEKLQESKIVEVNDMVMKRITEYFYLVSILYNKLGREILEDIISTMEKERASIFNEILKRLSNRKKRIYTKKEVDRMLYIIRNDLEQDSGKKAKNQEIMSYILLEKSA